ncbi:hypothetical protein NQS96_17250 [Pseudoalteromonas shioyasakiensis]|uniref:hypothetical protein n=1 Tax=Pseudoalteromonas TaxID=53246 RepID=UPI0015BA2D0C|nr:MULTISPECIES: hypothetical protein [Pseudoalteromonas]MCG9709809.1 hypothetical protein [Pseudoalteromonas sp. Isolate3]MCQ8883524.1 hypothetical protein [Pseudoalteromonas shioyasakiensis]QLE07609.1 hypothetical protein HYD28_00705 [Pseudoalteromonas shioyasakiensis]
MKASITSLLLVSVLFGCSSKQEPTPKLQHARLTEPQSELIALGIARLMHSKPVNVAEDAFINSSILVIESLNNAAIPEKSNHGSYPDMPERFELLIKNQMCFVRHLDSKATEPLPLVKCKAVD